MLIKTMYINTRLESYSYEKQLIQNQTLVRMKTSEKRIITNQ